MLQICPPEHTKSGTNFFINGFDPPPVYNNYKKTDVLVLGDVPNLNDGYHCWNIHTDLLVPLWTKLDLVDQLKHSWRSIDSWHRISISLNWSWFSGCLPLILWVESIPYHQGDGGTDMYEVAKSGPTYKACLLKYPIPCLCGHVGSWTQLGTYRASSLNQILRPF